MVSVFEGQLTRTWFFQQEDKKHVLNLYHDTISGVRSAALDYQEIRGSIGNSSLLMESRGHRIFFTIGNLPGYLEIKRSGWTGFEYGCVINDKVIKEVTQGVPENQDLLFQPKVTDSTFTADEESDYSIAWYVIQTRRITDGVQTTVHRRFREFAELNSQIKQNMKGHHLRDVLPPLPDKPSKHFTDHKDLGFIQERIFKLENFIVNMVSIPHVANMVCTKAFLGIMDQVREYSLTFHVPTLGMSLLPSERQGEAGMSPCVVGLIQKPEVCTGVLPGDTLSRVNGVPLAGTSFQGAVARIKSLPRPLIIHFVQVLGAASRTNAGPAVSSIQVKAISAPASATAPVSSSRPAPDNILDEVAGVLASKQGASRPAPAKSPVLFQGDLADDPPSTYPAQKEQPPRQVQQQVQKPTNPPLVQASTASDDNDYGAAGDEEVLVTAQVLSIAPRDPPAARPAASLSPVEFVDVDIVDAPPPAQARAGKVPVSAPKAGASAGAPAAVSAAVKVESPPQKPTAAAPATPAQPAVVPVPASPAATTATSTTKPAAATPTPGNPNGLGGVRARVAAMNASPQSATATPTTGAPASPPLAQPSAATLIPATTQPVSKPIPVSVKPATVPVPRNTSSFDDPPRPVISKASPATGKGSLFAEEVDGFSIEPTTAPTAAPAPAPAPVPVPVRVASAQRPVPATTAPAPAHAAPPAVRGSRTSFSKEPSVQLATTQPSTLPGWD